MKLSSYLVCVRSRFYPKTEEKMISLLCWAWVISIILTFERQRQEDPEFGGRLETQGVQGHWRTTAWSLCSLRPWTCRQVMVSSWLLAIMEAWDDETFTFWIGPPRMTTVVHDSTRGYVGVCGPCCFPRQRWSLRSIRTYTVCATMQCPGDVLRLCCLGAPSWREWHV